MIYDRCGQLTEHIPYPESLLNRRDFQTALWKAYYDNTTCTCYRLPGGRFSPYLPGQQPSGHQTGHRQQGHRGSQNQGTGGGNQHSSGGHHGNHGSHSQHSMHNRRKKRMVRDSNDGGPEGKVEATHKSSRCSKRDAFCRIVSSKGLKYRKRYKHVIEKALGEFCSSKAHNKHGCICPEGNPIMPCFCKKEEFTLKKHTTVSSSLCTCGYLKKKHRKNCSCKTC